MNFLPAGIINETISDMNEKSAELKKHLEEMNLEALKKGLNEMEEMALDLWVFIERFTCQPLMYTGQGETQEVIKRLDAALRFYEEHEQEDLPPQVEEKKNA